MKIRIKSGNVLNESADVLISTANPWLNLSGGVNGAIRELVGPEIQHELHHFLKSRALAALPAGSVVQSAAYGLPFKHILHAIAIDPFYDSSIELVRTTFATALLKAIEVGALTISSPTLATGYGPMTAGDFGNAIAPLLLDPRFNSLDLNLVVRKDEDVQVLKQILPNHI